MFKLTSSHVYDIKYKIKHNDRSQKYSGLQYKLVSKYKDESNETLKSANRLRTYCV
jgi:hypothetical protein